MSESNPAEAPRGMAGRSHSGRRVAPSGHDFAKGNIEMFRQMLAAGAAALARSLRLRVASVLAALACVVAVLLPATPAWATTEAPSAALNPALEARMLAISSELRCLVCQNQTIADSNAELANDLRRQIREMLTKGMGEREIIDYMTARYGDFVLYRPPFKSTTALLWIGPAVLMVLAVGLLVTLLRRRQRMAADAFDPDTPDEQIANEPNR